MWLYVIVVIPAVYVWGIDENMQLRWLYFVKFIPVILCGPGICKKMPITKVH